MTPRRWLRRAGIGATVLLTLAPLDPGNRLEVGRVSGNFFGELTLENLRLRQSGRELAFVRRLRVAYRLPRVRPPRAGSTRSRWTGPGSRPAGRGTTGTCSRSCAPP